MFDDDAGVNATTHVELGADAHDVAGFDLSLFNIFRPEAFQTAVTQTEHRFLSEAVELFRFDFRDTVPTEDRTDVDIEIRSPGTAHAFVYWFDLTLDESTTFSTSPMDSTSHWEQKVSLLLPPRRCLEGESVKLRATHKRRRLKLEFRA